MIRPYNPYRPTDSGLVRFGRTAFSLGLIGETMSLAFNRATLRPFHTTVAYDCRFLFNTYVVSTSNSLPEGEFMAELRLDPGQFDANHFRPKKRRDAMPVFTAGSLVILEHDQHCLGAGFVTREIEDATAPRIQLFVAPMMAPSRLSRPAQFSETGRLVVGYRLADDSDLSGTIRPVHAFDRSRLRNDIGRTVDPRFLEIFWTREERQQLEAEAAERLRIETAIKTFMTTLESEDAAA